MRGRFFDGKRSRPHDAEVSLDGPDVVIVLAEETRCWPLATLSVNRHAGEVRLSHPSEKDARLVVSESEWVAAGGADVSRTVERRSRSREWKLIGGLTAVGLGVAGFVFIGMPLLSGPLARATPVEYERRMGENFNWQVSQAFHTCEGAEGQAVLANLGNRIAAHSDTPFDISVRAVHAPMVNAFALPGGYVLVTDDLIEEAKGPDEVAAVIAHEIAHVENRHVMQAVWRALGVGMLLDLVVGGGTGAGQQAVLLAGQATELSFGRKQEQEADREGIAMLHAEGLDSRGMATFFERLAEGENEELSRATEFLQTHPDTRRRVAVARAMEGTGRSALTPDEWASVQATCGSSDTEDGFQRRWPFNRNDPLPGKPDQVGQH